MSASIDAHRLARLPARRLRTSVPVTLEAVRHAGGSSDRMELNQSIVKMGAAFILSGWKPRVRVKAGSRKR